MINYVSLIYKHGQRERECNTIEKAVSSLKNLGFSENWAVLSHADDLIILNYQGEICSRSSIVVELPFDEFDDRHFAKNFRSLLWNIFKPFLCRKRWYRSFIQVRLKSGGKYFYFVNISLIFDKEKDNFEKIYSSLASNPTGVVTGGESIFFVF